MPGLPSSSYFSRSSYKDVNPTDENNYYTLLGLPDNAPVEDIRGAFQRLKSEAARTGDWHKIKQASAAYDALMEKLDARDDKTTPENCSTAAARNVEPEETVMDFVFPPQEKVNIVFFAGRCIVFLLILTVGIRLMIHLPSTELAGHSFFHNISLPFHEAGHIFFRILGDFMATLGGSIMQVLVPVVCLVAFLKRRDAFASSFALWWTGQNFIDMAPYIYDARAQQLMLLGGVTGQDVPGYHDWNNILGRLGMLKLDHTLGNMSHFFGSVLMIAAFLWCGIILFMQYKNLDR